MKKALAIIALLITSVIVFTACSTSATTTNQDEILLSDPTPTEIEARDNARENVDEWNDEVTDGTEYIENDVDRFVDTAKKEYDKNVKPTVDEFAESQTWADVKSGADDIWMKTKNWTCKNFKEPVQEYVNSENCKR